MAHKKSRHRHILKTPTPAAAERAILPLGALMFAASMSSWAQTADDDTKTLKPVVVKATAETEPSGKDSLRATTTRIGKGKQQLRDIPQSVTVVTEKLLDDRKVDTVKEALKMTSGVTFLAAEGGEEDIRLRGYALNATGDLFIDGMRDPAFYDRDTFNMDRIEVMRGSASMLFGRGSTGGAVNQVNKQAKLVDESQIDLTLGSHQYRRAVADVNVKTGDEAALRITAMRTLADNNGAGSSIDKQGVAASLRWGIGSRDEFELAAYHLENNNGINYGMPWIRPTATSPASSTTMLPIDPKAYYGMASDYNDGSASYFTLAHTHRFSGDTELVTKIRKGEYRRDQRSGAIRFAGAALQPGGLAASLATLGPDTVLTRGNHVKNQSFDNLFVQSDLSTKFEALGLRHEVITGIDAAMERKRVFAGSAVTKPRTAIGTPDDGASIDEGARILAKTSEFESVSGGAYVQDLIQVAEHWKLLGGLRYDGMSSTFSNPANANAAYRAVDQAFYKASQRVGVLYQPSDRQSFHLSYATSFNTAADTYSYSASSPKDADPEKSANFELGAKLDSADRRVSTRLALFRAVKFNERNTDPLISAGVLSKKRHATGFEMDAAGRITPRWEVYGSYTWIWDAEIDKPADGQELYGQRPSLIPKHQGSLWSTYQINEKLRAGAGLTGRSKMAPNRNPGWYSEGYVTYDAMAEYEAIQDKLTLKANVINIANKLYADALYSGHYIPGFGRTYYVTASLKF